MADIIEDGLTLLTPEGSNEAGFRVNIVFIHGLRGHPRKTWEETLAAVPERPSADRRLSLQEIRRRRLLSRRESSESGIKTTEPSGTTVFWPEDLLVPDLPEARIWTCGYNAKIINGPMQANNQDSVIQHGQNLANRLERDIDNKDPFIFVAHSLGGIALKYAFSRSAEIRARTQFIVFLGTPHRGSTAANLGLRARGFAALAGLSANKSILPSLSVNSEDLKVIHQEFVTRVLEEPVRIHSFREGRALAGIGIAGLGRKIVEDDSSEVGLPNLEKTETIDADHRAMARCRDRKDPRYRAIYGVLHQYLSGAIAVPDSRHASLNSLVGSDNAKNTTCNLPFDSNPHFVGRTQILEQLEKTFFFGQQTGHRTAAIVGLGGMGKTSVAQRFAELVRDNHSGYSVFWMSMSNTEAFEQSCRQIQRQENLEVNDSSTEDVKSLVHNYLSSSASGRWLLVVDNVDDKALMMDLQSDIPSSALGLRLVTSRNEDAARHLSDKIIHMNELCQAEAEELLSQLLEQGENLIPVDDEDRTALLSSLNNLPLAITQATAYLIRNRVSARDYLQLLLGKEEEAITLLNYDLPDRRRYRGEGLHNAVCKTWLVSFDHLRRDDEEEGNGLAIKLLMFLSRIEPQNIPRHMLMGFQADVEAFNRALGTLQAYAFISPQGTGSNLYGMHNLLHLSARAWVDQQSRTTEATEIAISHMSQVLRAALEPTKDGHEEWTAFLPHTLRVLAESKSDESSSRSDLMGIFSKCLDACDREAGAFRLGQSTQQKLQLDTVEDDQIVVAYQKRASYYQKIGESDTASSILEELVGRHPESSYDDVSAKIELQCKLLQVTICSNLSEDDLIRKGMEIIQSLESMIERCFASDNQRLCEAKLALVGRLLALQQLDLATTVIQNAMRAEQQRPEPDKPRLVEYSQLRGLVYFFTEKWRAAIEIWEPLMTEETTVPVDETVGSYSRHLLTQHYLVRAYCETSEHEKLLHLAKDLIPKEQRFWGANHHRTMWTMERLQDTHQSLQQVDQAIDILYQIIPIKEHNLEARDSHHDYLDRVFMNARGDYELSQMAHSSYQHMVFTSEAKKNSRPGWWQMELGYLLLSSNRASEGIEVFEKILVRLQNLAQEHQETPELVMPCCDLTAEDVVRFAHRLEECIRIEARNAKSMGERDPELPAEPNNLIATDSGFFEQEDESELGSESVKSIECSEAVDDPTPLVEVTFLEVEQLTGYLRRAVRFGMRFIPQNSNHLKSELQYHLALGLFYSGQINEALTACESAVELGVKYGIGDDLDYMEKQFWLAGVYWKVNQFEEGLRTIEALVNVGLLRLKADDERLLRWQVDLAMKYKEVGRLAEGIEIMERVTTAMANIASEDNPDLLNWWHTLGFMYLNQSDKLSGSTQKLERQKGIDLLEKYVAIRAGNPADKAGALLHAQSELAVRHVQCSQWDKAVIYREAVAETARTSPDFDQEQRLWNLRRLAVCYRMLRLVEKEEELQPELEALREALKDLKVSPQASPDLRETNSGFWFNKDDVKYIAYTISDALRSRSSNGLRTLDIVREF